MKAKLLLSTLLAALFSGTSAQNLIINGSLENNTASGNMLDLHDWSSVVSNAWEIDGGTMDLLTSNACGGASDGNWFVETSHNFVDFYTSFSLGLSVPLVIGNQYTLSFDKKLCSSNSTPIKIGIISDSTIWTGPNIQTFSAPSTNSWVTETIVFSASVAGKFIGVSVQTSLNNSQVDLDNFILTAVATGIKESSFQDFNIFPNPNNGVFSVLIKNEIQKAELVISNTLGEKIYTSYLNSNNAEIDLSKEPKGIYFYTITNEQAIVGHGKFIIR